MTQIHAAGATDTGQVRQANEDAFLMGASVFAVADGMGGHLAGEVASMTALEPVHRLDGRVFPDASAALNALREAVVEANQAVARKAADEPTYRGMGTTLTAALLEGRRLHVAHVGDSRAYLLRGNEFSQLTDDHTLVQHLIDEGQITAEEAATHPQRSIITRAIGVSRDIDVDAMTLDIEDGDQVLLCSDGLTGVISDETIASQLANNHDLETTIQRLIDAANASGGPDNITAVLLRFGEQPGPVPASPGDTGELEGPEGRRVIVRTGDGEARGDWAQRLGRFGTMGRDRGPGLDEGAPSGPTRLQRLFAVLLGLALLAALVIGGGRWLLSRSYYVGLDESEVVIYQGIPATLGPVSLSWVFQRTELTTDDLPRFIVNSLRDDGAAAADLADARRIVENYRDLSQPEPEPTPEPTLTPTESPTTSP